MQQPSENGTNGEQRLEPAIPGDNNNETKSVSVVLPTPISTNEVHGIHNREESTDELGNRTRIVPTNSPGSTIRLNSWHDHVYATPPRAPTPYRISDILGWGSSTCGSSNNNSNNNNNIGTAKLLVPTPRRLTSSLIRAPLALYSPLPAHSPALLQGCLTSPTCTLSPAPPLKSPSSIASLSSPRLYCAESFLRQSEQPFQEVGGLRHISPEKTMSAEDEEDRPLNLTTTPRTRSPPSSPSSSVLSGHSIIYTRTPPTAFREPQLEHHHLLGVHHNTHHTVHQPYLHNGKHPADVTSPARPGKCIRSSTKDGVVPIIKTLPAKRKKVESGTKETPLAEKGGGDVRPGEPEDASEADRKKKKARTTFTGRQIFELEKQFEVKKYLSSSERADMAKLLNVTETQVSALIMSFLSNFSD